MDGAAAGDRVTLPRHAEASGPEELGHNKPGELDRRRVLQLRRLMRRQHRGQDRDRDAPRLGLGDQLAPQLPDGGREICEAGTPDQALDLGGVRVREQLYLLLLWSAAPFS